MLALHGHLDGLWLLLVGWFLAGSASAERAAAVVVGRLAGLRVADVMSAPPAVTSGWWTVQALIDHLLGESGRHYRQFPLVDIDGRLAGVVDRRPHQLPASRPPQCSGTAVGPPAIR
ncbi:MAG TPA: hypothetical protein VN748_19200 [Pseudonocardiaceae bacterium]|nr:hypothetical protein [Pseudonocardiaceae bacterium]